MKIQYRLRGFDQRRPGPRPLDRALDDLGLHIPISAATVALEQRWEASPPFSAWVELAVPGPDIHAAARDHTLEAVLRKVVDRLAAQIEDRNRRRQLRLKRREPFRTVASQWAPRTQASSPRPRGPTPVRGQSGRR
ncbi:MAG TPA: HPF/RaiA family ribosome-associated protein [Lacunisphaera sp.]|nr:HPF/RaiA family ribosome-associated protein [Lacunisphaera sp.]